MKKIILVVGGIVLLSACSRYATTGEKIYPYSRNGANLIVPPPLTDSNISHFYDLPAQQGAAQVSITPPGAALSKQ